MAVGDIYDVVVQYSCQSRIFLCTLAYEQTVGDDVPDVAQILADSYISITDPEWVNILASDCEMQCVKTRKSFGFEQIPGTAYYASGTVGTELGPSLPGSSALVIQFVTDNPLPRHNGRKFLGGLPEQRLISGILVGAYLTGPVTSWRSVHQATIQASGGNNQEFEPRVINRQAGGVPIIPPTVSNVVLLTANGFIRRQIRRRTRETQVS